MTRKEPKNKYPDRTKDGRFAEGNQAARTHGLYAKQLTAEERENYSKIKVGTIDDEIRMLKIMLQRVYKAEREEIKKNGKRVNDFSDHIFRYTRLINRMEGYRQKLIEPTETEINLSQEIRNASL